MVRTSQPAAIRRVDSREMFHRIAIPTVLAVAVTFGGCRSASRDNSSTVLKSAPSVSSDIRVVTPADADFDSELAGLLGDKVQVIKQLEPYVLIVTNQSKRRVVAYSPVWTITGRDGEESGHLFNLSLKYPNAVAGNEFPRGEELYPGETRIATTGAAGDKNLVRTAELWPSEPHGAAFFTQRAQSQREEFKNPAAVEIGLDAVIFEDGELVGPDHGHLEQHFSAFVNANQSLYKKIVDDTSAGASIDDVFTKLKVVAADTHGGLGKPGSQFQIYDALAAQEAISWRRKHGDAQLIAHFKNAIRPTPFVIKRRAISTPDVH